MTSLENSAEIRSERFKQLAIKWTTARWRHSQERESGVERQIIGRCKPTQTRWISSIDPEDRLFADFLVTFLDNPEEAENCFRYAQGWKGASRETKPAGQRVVAWLVRQRAVFGSHRKYCSPRDFPEALESYVTLVSNQSKNSSSQVRMFKETKSFDPLFELIKERVHSFDRLGSWDYLVRVYSDRSLGQSASFDFEPESLYLEAATGPKEGWHLILFGLRDGPELTKDRRESADEMVRAVIQESGLTESEQKPFVWFEIEDLLCNCQKNDKVKADGRSTTIRNLTEEYLSLGTEESMQRLLAALSRA